MVAPLGFRLLGCYLVLGSWVNFLMLLSKTFLEKFCEIVMVWDPLLSNMNPSSLCHGYLQAAH